MIVVCVDVFWLSKKLHGPARFSRTIFLLYFPHPFPRYRLSRTRFPIVSPDVVNNIDRTAIVELVMRKYLYNQLQRKVSKIVDRVDRC